MKRCPECRRDYYDDTLLYCLDDGFALLEGPGSDGGKTAILPSDVDSQKLTARLPKRSTTYGNASGKRKWLLPGAVAAIFLVSGFAVYWFWLTDSQPRISGSFRSVDSPAYDYYLRGKIDSTSQNRERNQNAVHILEEVVAADPGFAPASAALARAYGIRADLFAQKSEQKKLYNKAKLAAEKALAIEPNLAEAHLARGAIIWNHVDRFPHEQSIQAYKKAIALDPGIEEAHHLLGLVYYHIGLFEKSEAELQKALELDSSNSLVRFRIGLVSSYKMNNEEALRILKTVPRDANQGVIDRALAVILFHLGRTEEAWKIVNEFLASRTDEGGNITSVKAMLLAKEGRKQEAEEAVKEAVRIGEDFQHFHHATYNIASAYALMNDLDQSLKWLQFTADEGFPCYPLFDKDKNLDNLRQDDRFKSMMAELKQQWERHNATL
ncbi:MAG: tetratricopeptide repeat protein [Acidobacteria bacterium]|nr:tetratricopeptide repeat protein [Acidobacteriota bacterium]